MNERIRELAEQAGLKYYNWSTNESNIIDGEFKYPRPEDLEKFAELIVRECAEVASAPLSFTEAAYCRIDLLKHFGVEL